VSEWQYYRYQAQFFTWTLAEQADFETALDGLTQEVRLFCLLKTMANFGVKLTWPNLQKALSQAVAIEAISAEQHKACNEVFEALVFKGLEKEGLVFNKERLEKVKLGLVTSPSYVMGVFAELKAFEVTSVWADFMDT